MICLSIANSTFDKCMGTVKEHELCEIRLDSCKLSDSEIEILFKSHKNLIATFRPANFNDNIRASTLIRAIGSGASYVDIELENSDIFKEEIVKKARDCNCKVIISYHNYNKTPSRRELKEIVKWSFETGADIAKIACMPRTQKEISRILSIYDIESNENNKIISIGMGEAGKITRILATFLGAPFTYASISAGEETAPGQIEKEQLIDIIKRLEGV